MTTKPRAKRPTGKTQVEVTWYTRWEYFLKFMQIKQAMEQMQGISGVNPDKCLNDCIEKIWNDLQPHIGLS